MEISLSRSLFLGLGAVIKFALSPVFVRITKLAILCVHASGGCRRGWFEICIPGVCYSEFDQTKNILIRYCVSGIIFQVGSYLHEQRHWPGVYKMEFAVT